MGPLTRDRRGPGGPDCNAKDGDAMAIVDALNRVLRPHDTLYMRALFAVGEPAAPTDDQSR